MNGDCLYVSLSVIMVRLYCRRADECAVTCRQ